MRGCLTLPFRLALLALLILGGFAAWTYRREIKRQIHGWTADSAVESGRGTGNPASAAAVRKRIQSLESPRTDSVVLSASEVAGLVAGFAESAVPRAVDSVEVRLDRDDMEVRAQVDTKRVPVALGPLAGVVHDRELVEAGGRLVFRRTGVAEWQVDRVRVRGLPIPLGLFGPVLQRFSSGTGGGVFEFNIPRTVSGLRVTPTGVTLYGPGGSR